MFTTKSTKQSSSFTAKQGSLGSNSKHRAGKSSASKGKRALKEQTSLCEKAKRASVVNSEALPADKSNSPIVTIAVGPDGRLFACHESVLCVSPYFRTLCRSQLHESTMRRITLCDEIPEVFSSVLEYLYRGDYHPCLVHDKKRNSWTLDGKDDGSEKCIPVVTTVSDIHSDQVILKDTAIYCSADRFGLEDLKSISLRKQGLQSKIQCSTILASARYAYDNTPESDAKLRAHYLALIIRSRHTFKRSGTLQSQMEIGGKMFFDLFVAMCNHMDDISSITKSPR